MPGWAQPGGAAARRPDVVLLVLDEFPGDSLLDSAGASIRSAIPNLAALAADATWFRNAYSVYDSTTKAVPLILDGMRPVPGSQATSATTRSRSSRLWPGAATGRSSSEEASAICPPRLCRGAPTRRPAILPRLAGGREARFDRFVRGLRPGRAPDAVGEARCCCPTGRTCTCRPAPDAEGVRDLVPGMNGVPGFHDPFLTRHNEQRYLLQLGFVDRLIGRLLRRLKGRECTTGP